jgi:hypothetical protein
MKAAGRKPEFFRFPFNHWRYAAKTRCHRCIPRFPWLPACPVHN